MLDVNHVTKKYGKNIACNDVTFTLEPGSLTVLLGPNGAGKSTIIKSIIGFLKYDGSITVNGIENKTPAARKIMGYIPELPSLYPTLTVIEHMEFIARAYKMTNYKDRIEMLLERFEMGLFYFDGTSTRGVGLNRIGFHSVEMLALKWIDVSVEMD